MTSSATTAAAFEDLQWLQRFAMSLTREADEADDLVQDTLVAAWRDAPDEGRPLRPWLASALRNRFRMLRRGQIRRTHREQLAPQAEAPLDPDAAQARFGVLRVLLTELESLPEEEQNLIARRFFDGDSAVEIARALGVPSATIRTRLHRSLRRLRSSLDRKYGDRSAWCGAVLSLSPSKAALTAAPTPSLASAGSKASSSKMSITARLLTLCAIGTVGATGWFATQADTAPDATAGPTEPMPTAIEASTSPTPRRRWERRREQIHAELASAPGTDDEGPTESLSRAPGTHEVFREFVTACMDDLESGHAGALTFSVREIGAPDVGVIFESFEIVHTSFEDEAVLECIFESMYGFVGDAPERPYQRDSNWTVQLGEPERPADRDRQMFDAIVGAHHGEVRFCGTQADPPPEGTVQFTMRMADDGTVAESTFADSELPRTVVDCLTTATLRWKFPPALAGKTFDFDFSVPVAGRFPAAEPR